jgi:hypothetical protein
VEDHSGGKLLSSAPPNLVQELPLCNHPHAMAKSPIEATYCAPFINTALIIVMVFLLP